MARIGGSSLDIFPLCLGGNVFGWTADESDSFALLDAFVDGGGNLVDTADVYSAWAPGHSGGESEETIGRWRARSAARDKLLLATKVGAHPQLPGLSSDAVSRAVDASLARLGVESVDLLYAHRDDPEMLVPEMASTFSALVDSGKARHIGLSNFTPARIDEWCTFAEAEGLHAPVALQPHYSLVERDFEVGGLREVAERHTLGVLPYYGLARGFLTGKYRPGVEVDSVRATGERSRASGARDYLDHPRGIAVLEALDEVSAARGVAAATVALAWLRQQPTVVAPIASARTPAQLPDLLESVVLELDDHELTRLGEASTSP